MIPVVHYYLLSNLNTIESNRASLKTGTFPGSPVLFLCETRVTHDTPQSQTRENTSINQSKFISTAHLNTTTVNQSAVHDKLKVPKGTFFVI